MRYWVCKHQMERLQNKIAKTICPRLAVWFRQLQRFL